MQVGFGAGTFYVKPELMKEFTKFNPNDEHSYPAESGQDYLILMDILARPIDEQPAELLKEASDLPSFLRLRRFAFEILGLTILEPAFQNVLMQLILRPTAKDTAKSLGFHGRGFKTKKEQHYVDRDVTRCLKKLRPVKLLDLSKL